MLSNNATAPAVVPTPSPTTIPAVAQAVSTDRYCTPSQLKAEALPEGAAGNIYVTLTIKNISKEPCQIVGNNTLSVDYPSSVTNFQTVNKKPATTPMFTLEPNQKIYALIHYPNGPQCSSKATAVNTMVSYAISPNDSVIFTPVMDTTLSILSCESNSDITTIDLYGLSDTEVLP